MHITRHIPWEADWCTCTLWSVSPPNCILYLLTIVIWIMLNIFLIFRLCSTTHAAPGLAECLRDETYGHLYQQVLIFLTVSAFHYWSVDKSCSIKWILLCSFKRHSTRIFRNVWTICACVISSIRVSTAKHFVSATSATTDSVSKSIMVIFIH